jgi:nitroreductase
MSEKKKDIHAILRMLWSSRVMDPDRPVPPQIIELLLEAARWAPSSGNGQPWRYLVFDERTPEARQAPRGCLHPINQIWANRAPVLLLAVAKEVRDNGKFNPYAQHDVGLANENFLLQAIALGLHCRPMAGFDHEKAGWIFHIQQGYRPMMMIAIGYPGDREDLPREVQLKEARPRKRLPLEAFEFHGDWEPPYRPSSQGEA